MTSQPLSNHYDNQFSTKKTTFYNESSFFFFLNNWRRVWNRVRLFITKWFHTQIIQIWNLQFFFGSENLHKVKNWSQKSTERSKQVTRIHSDRYRGAERTFLFIDGLSFIIRRLYLSSKRYSLFAWHRTLKSSKVGK